MYADLTTLWIACLLTASVASVSATNVQRKQLIGALCAYFIG